MATERGDNVRLYVLGASATALACASERNFDLSINGDAIDVTSKDSSQMREYIAGFSDATIDIDGLYESDDNGFGRLDTQIKAGSSVILQIFVGGSRDSSCTAIVTGLSRSHTYDDAASYSASFRVNGAISS